MANPYPAGALVVDSTHPLASNLKVALLSRPATEDFRECVLGATLALGAAADFDADGYAYNTGGGIQSMNVDMGSYRLSTTGAHSIIVDAFIGAGAGSALASYWLFKVGPSGSAYRLPHTGNNATARVVDNYQVADNAYHQKIGSLTYNLFSPAALTVGEAVAFMVGNDGANFLVAGSSDGGTNKFYNVSANGTLQAYSFPGSTFRVDLFETGQNRIRALYVFDKALSQAEFDSFVANPQNILRTPGVVTSINAQVGVSTSVTHTPQLVGKYVRLQGFKDEDRLLLANLSNIRWWFFDTPLVGATLPAPSCGGVVGSISAGGEILLNVGPSTLAAGQVGFLVLTTSDGDRLQSPAGRTFGFPVLISSS